MTYTPYLLATDVIYFALIALLLLLYKIKKERIKDQFKKVLVDPKGLITCLILCFYFLIASLDCVHFTVEKPTTVFQEGSIVSLLDILLKPSIANTEKTYSAPLSRVQFTAEFKQIGQKTVTWVHPKLKIIAPQIYHNDKAYHRDLFWRFLASFLAAALLAGILYGLLAFSFIPKMAGHETQFSIVFLSTLFMIFLFVFLVFIFQAHYHLLGTDKIGEDVLYMSIKSIRTGIILGVITTLVMLPFAVLLGIMAGYAGGILDDMIQFIYTTLSSIPAVLLVIASVLSLQLFIDNHFQWFSSLAFRADLRLLLLCLILGITSWTGLCRVLRAETLKIRELEFIQASKILGTSSFNIIRKHILPNVAHIIFISVILDISLVVLAEAVLTYIGVGVAPNTFSWGNMIDAARMELARTPAIWWPIVSAFWFMLVFILSLNVFADVVRSRMR